MNARSYSDISPSKLMDGSQYIAQFFALIHFINFSIKSRKKFQVQILAPNTNSL